MSALLQLGMSPCSGSLEVDCFQLTLDISDELYVSSSCISSPRSIQVSGWTCHRWTHTSYSSATLLDGSSLASHSSQHVGKYPLLVSHCKRPQHGCFSQPHSQGSTIIGFKPLAAQRCVLHREGFSSVCQVVVRMTGTSTTNIHQ